MMNNLLMFGNVLAWIMGVIVYYFSNTGALSERLAVTETKLSQEMLGYRNLQDSTGKRLESIEKKVDCLLDKRMCR